MTTKAKCNDVTWKGHADCSHCSVRHMVLFANLADADLDGALMPIEEMTFAPQTTLYRAGERGDYVYTIRSGLLKLFQYLPNGTQRIVRLLRPGDVAGLEILVNGTYHHGAVSVQATNVCRIPVAVLKNLDQSKPQLHRELMVRWQRSLDQADAIITLFSTGSSQARVARLLLHLGHLPADTACNLLGREDMSALLGITVETASRTVAEFKRRGFIKTGNGQCDYDAAALQKIAQD